MSYASSRYRNGQTVMCSPSRFLRDIDPAHLNLIAGASLGAARPSFESYRTSYHSPASSYRQSVESSRKPVSRAASKVAVGDRRSASELKAGTRIEHSRFGTGTVTSVDTSPAEDRITVDFDNTGTKVLLLKFARFKIIE